MTKQYFELRKQSARGTDSIAADMMRHFHARQHVGKALVICNQPVGMLAACRRQWLKMGRTIQRQRSSTLNADKILKYTHVITRMQHMHFSTKHPLEDPEAAVYFLAQKQYAVTPVHCYSLYLAADTTDTTVDELVEQLPDNALVIDYRHHTDWKKLGLLPKRLLEERVAKEWERVHMFLSEQHISLEKLFHDNIQNVEAMDDALDTLLNVSHQFLRVANDFHHALGLARPLRTSPVIRRQHDSLMLLAYRVQALSPGIFTHHFLETYNEDDTFFLYDRHKRRFTAGGESLVDAVNRHARAGRPHLARALQLVFSI